MLEQNTERQATKLETNSKQMNNILKQRLSENEKQALISEGFNIKRPTKQTLILVALYKKAAAGDMNAIKEIRQIVSSSENSVDGVTIIDDVQSDNI